MPESHYQALIADLRSHASEDEVKALADQIDSRFMRWGVRHSLGEGYTAQEAEQLAATIPFAGMRIGVRSIGMDVWLEK